MFAEATNFDGELNNWSFYCVWSVECGGATTMSHMLWKATKFNRDLDNWNVERVYLMDWMFAETNYFDGLTRNWNVSTVEDMSYMFYNAGVSGQSLGASCTNCGFWDVSEVTNFSHMFDGANNFDDDLSGWTPIKADDMSYMFASSSFNGDISTWDVSSVSTMEYMFLDNDNYDQPIDSWDLSGIDINHMFFRADAFDQDLSTINFSGVSNMDDMLEEASSFSQFHYDGLLINCSTNGNPGGVYFKTEAMYTGPPSAASTARTDLDDNQGWIFIDGGPN